MRREAGTVGALVWELCGWIDRLFPDAARGQRLKGALDERFGDDARAVTGDLCREIEAVAHDFSRHFALEYVADRTLVPDTEPPGWPPQDPRDVQRRAGSVGEVRRRHDGVGVLALDGLDGVHITAAYLGAAFALLGRPITSPPCASAAMCAPCCQKPASATPSRERTGRARASCPTCRVSQPRRSTQPSRP
jgi:hypothetical protein